MEITSHQSYAADPARVHAMMTDPAYLAEVCRRGGATSQTIDVQGDTTTVTMALPAPEQVRKFVGESLDVTQVVVWEPAAADGRREGTLDLTVKGMPVVMKGRATMAPAGATTEVNYLADLKVNIPLLGKKLEQAAAPSISRALQVQQQVGTDYLAERA
ncbi:DUF2505 domain-containing protein [Aestuariimicrobium ganziense]|uniref:DUF2505 domain-containing protein n=1 Tax=Aestuariimicrobium ganziense TaxID=2773677 RepID=UPI0019440F90|nr:DUF2505 domain-containing protein [Aestuariimicrobium ganziense]